MKNESIEVKSIFDKTDLDLVLEFQRGRESAFDELVKRHMQKAVELVYVVVGNYEDAKDISQEAFVKVYHSLKGFQNKSKFSTWLYRILINGAKDFLRKKRWKRFLNWDSSESMDNFFEQVEDRDPSPRKGVLGKELDQKITEAIGKLPFKQQWVFSLRFFEGFSIQEISEATELAEGTVKATLHFAIQKFKSVLAPYIEGRC